MSRLFWLDMKHSHSPHLSCRGLSETTAVLQLWEQKGAAASAGWVGGYYEGVLGRRWALHLFDMRCCHGCKQNGAEIDSLRWSTTTKQLSGLRLQNEYRRRPISAGMGPSLKHHSQPGDWTLRLSLLSWFITQSVKKDPKWRNRGMRKSTPHRQAIRLGLIITFQNKLRRSMGACIQESQNSTNTHSFSVTERRYIKEYERN